LIVNLAGVYESRHGPR